MIFLAVMMLREENVERAHLIKHMSCASVCVCVKTWVAQGTHLPLRCLFLRLQDCRMLEIESLGVHKLYPYHLPVTGILFYLIY